MTGLNDEAFEKGKELIRERALVMFANVADDPFDKSNSRHRMLLSAFCYGYVECLNGRDIPTDIDEKIIAHFEGNMLLREAPGE